MRIEFVVMKLKSTITWILWKQFDLQHCQHHYYYCRYYYCYYYDVLYCYPLLCYTFPQELMREQTLHSGKAYVRFHVHWDPGRNSDSTGPGARPTCMSLRVSWQSRGWQWLTVGTRPPWQSPREWSSPRPFLEVAILAPIISVQAPVTGHLRPDHQWSENTALPIRRQAA